MKTCPHGGWNVETVQAKQWHHTSTNTEAARKSTRENTKQEGHKSSGKGMDERGWEGITIYQKRGKSAGTTEEPPFFLCVGVVLRTRTYALTDHARTGNGGAAAPGRPSPTHSLSLIYLERTNGQKDVPTPSRTMK
mmetsp:Transcript_20962/g.41855  ORF Transcript_20962/g.41855 Transcript_20962/m.41855 type:complete len:136 (+) Transcript_20962:583-990(+)